ncbi:MAG: hypothetical protein A2W80_05345 [Candidatus Riflebacteria bacterium GWC2_50_8]|nr:MAG: hypothetical protein A2W80_05345 [Candidatus Riflebacteria bacterium GWC2_50_8]
MRLAAVLRVLRSLEPTIREKFGVQRIGVFGSVARDVADEDSDVDLLVEMPPDLYAMVHLKEMLEDALQSRVDLIRYRKDLSPFLKARIDREAVNV